MGKLLEELKRRKVFRVAAVYAVVAWLLIQMADTLAPMMNLPEFAPRLILFFLIMLFPVALFLAWAYEITPDGIKVDSGDVTETSSSGNLATGIFILLIALAGGGFYLFSQPSAPEAVTESVAGDIRPVDLEKSIAVLPFTAFSSNPDEQYFADGLADTLLHKLAQLSDIRVISRTSSFQYRGEAVDVRQVGEDLSVATVLEGSVQRSGDRLRIIAQLVNTQDGGHIWSQTFDRDSEDIFAIHDEISEAVVRSLQVSMSPDERQRIGDSGTNSAEAYNLLTRITERRAANPMFDMNAEVFRQETFDQIEEIESVLALDPNYAEAYRAIARAYDLLIFRSPDAALDSFYIRKAFEALHQAMLLEPNNPVSYIGYSSLHRRQGDILSAEVFARMALNRLPNDTGAIANLALSLTNQGKNYEEALELTYREEAADPNGSTIYRRRVFALRGLGRFEEAVDVTREQFGKEGISQQLVANDLFRTQSLYMGQQLAAAGSLLDFRKSVEDGVGDVFLRSWLNMANILELDDEIEMVIDRVTNESDRRVATISSLAIEGRLEDARQQVSDYISATNIPGPNSTLAQICILLEDYDCAVSSFELYRPNLISSASIFPTVIGRVDFEFGIQLVHAYNKTGATESASRLLRELNEWYQPRAAAGFVDVGSYTLAEFFIQLNDTAAALASLRERIMMEEDNFIPQCIFCRFESSLYEPLRDNPEFQELVAEYERRRAVNAAQVRELIAEAGF